MDNEFLQVDLATARVAAAPGTYTVKVLGYRGSTQVGAVKGDLRARVQSQGDGDARPRRQRAQRHRRAGPAPHGVAGRELAGGGPPVVDSRRGLARGRAAGRSADHGAALSLRGWQRGRALRQAHFAGAQPAAQGGHADHRRGNVAGPAGELQERPGRLPQGLRRRQRPKVPGRRAVRQQRPTPSVCRPSETRRSGSSARRTCSGR